jgi:hypothetical protein
MENSPLHVCRLQPARSELMSALLDAGGAFGARVAFDKIRIRFNSGCRE